jgi:hypothetical protein
MGRQMAAHVPFRIEGQQSSALHGPARRRPAIARAALPATVILAAKHIRRVN